jgi:hypothetical protein
LEGRNHAEGSKKPYFYCVGKWVHGELYSLPQENFRACSGLIALVALMNASSFSNVTFQFFSSRNGIYFLPFDSGLSA